ncbi:hypothetical protein ANCCEY_10546 [Ancylostoma ceylanicum]|uniref:SCP domain-containing protein n=1 Tax=Ancylostoma ceylanicum TaxID=53326 RepID=A0A0D6LGQ6_9BILA|nr:hypothetical protein ANCCEY_10546 [Ancylostoma ceylanicum]
MDFIEYGGSYIKATFLFSRGSIARGQTERNGDWGIAPPATLMYRMKYDCEAEAYAMSHAQTCDRELLLPDERPGYKENIHVLDTVQTTPEGAAQHVSFSLCLF